MRRLSSEPLTGIAGFVAMAAWIGAYPIGVAIPDVDAPADLVATYAAQHRTALLAFGVLVAIGATLLVVFFTGLHDQLRAAAPSVSALASR